MRALSLYFGFFCEQGILPESGGANDQTACAIEAFRIIGDERGRIMKEKMDKARKGNGG